MQLLKIFHFHFSLEERIATNFLLVDWANKHLIKNNQITPIANRKDEKSYQILPLLCLTFAFVILNTFAEDEHYKEDEYYCRRNATDSQGKDKKISKKIIHFLSNIHPLVIL